jgi:hypothetical protein
MCENIDPTRWIAWWEITVLSMTKNLLSMDLVVAKKGHWRYFGQGGGQPLFGNIDVNICWNCKMIGFMLIIDN